jgi:hypothetical protein
MFTTGQAVAGTAATLMFVMPPGPCTVVINNVSAVTAYVGPGGTALTSSNGFPIASGQSVAWNGLPAGGGASMYVIAASGTTNAVGFLVSAASAQTGP